MKVQGDQLQQMRGSSEKAFYDKLRDDVLTFMAETAPDVPNEDVHRRIDAARATAAEDRMLTERDIIRYEHLIASLSPEYREAPETAWLTAILRSSDSAEARLDQISTVLKGQSR